MSEIGEITPLLDDYTSDELLYLMMWIFIERFLRYYENDELTEDNLNELFKDGMEINQLSNMIGD